MNGSQDNKELASVKAQAIASRTFACHRSYYVGTIDNSNTYQVFLPYRYATLITKQQDRVREAVLGRHYMTEDASTYPIDAAYGADNPAQTVAGTPTLIGNINYLRSIEDAISARDGKLEGNGIGMSSKGASRWGFGHTSSLGSVAENHKNYPADRKGDGIPWSVRWDNPFQILTHYYTGIHLRDANANNALLTPAYRWVPLRIDKPVLACANRDVPVQIWLQNTGTVDWAATAVLSVITNSAVTPAAVTETQDNEIPQVVTAGSDVRITRMVRPTSAGTFDYTIDLFTSGVGLFSAQSPSWPRYAKFTVYAITCTADVYLPVVQNAAVAADANQ